MIIDNIKSANIAAMKNKDSNLRAIYSVIINKHMQAVIDARTTGQEVGDDDTTKIILKTIKELTEEAENYKKVNHINEYNKILQQQAALEIYLPKMLTEHEIVAIINTLPNKTVPFVMRHFKQHYGASADLKLVSSVLKQLS